MLWDLSASPFACTLPRLIGLSLIGTRGRHVRELHDEWWVSLLVSYQRLCSLFTRNAKTRFWDLFVLLHVCLDTGSPLPPRQLRRRSRPEALPLTTTANRDTLTSVALTDGFDAPTEAPTVWNTTGIEGVEGRDYEVTITGYQNYVTEMEMMLSGQEHTDISPVQPVQPYYPEREPGVVLSVRGGEGGMGGRARGHSHSHSHDTSARRRSADGSREVSLRSAKTNVELVEHRVVEDGPKRTITLWREQVAASGSLEDIPSSVQQPVPRTTPSNESQLSPHYISNRSREQSTGSGRSGSAGHGKGTSKESGAGGADGYQRTEVSFLTRTNYPITMLVYSRVVEIVYHLVPEAVACLRRLEAVVHAVHAPLWFSLRWWWWWT